MKLTALLFLLGCLGVSAKSIAQQVTIKARNATLQQVFTEIEQQSGYHFFYADEDLKVAKPVTFTAEKESLPKVLQRIFAGQPLSYSIVDKTIMVKAVKPIIARHSIPADFYAGPRQQKSNSIPVEVYVRDSLGFPLVGAIVKIKGTKLAGVTDSKGMVLFQNTPHKATIIVSFVGFETQEKTNDGDFAAIIIVLQQKAAALADVETEYSNGYQNIPKDRATGSYEIVDNKLINRSVSSNILDRLNGVVSSVYFDTRAVQQTLPSAPTPKFTIRGLSTINANAAPLIILDNFPYKGDINNINPNDVESITVLKDAAAASIWGAQAGNGVVVITTKRGRLNQKPTVDFNSSVSVGTKPNLFAQRQISTNDYINMEDTLFQQGFYDAIYNNPQAYSYQPLFPVVSLLYEVKNGQISQSSADAQIDQWRKLDVRNDLLKYFYKPVINQQYSLDVKGGSAKNTYFLSGGFNRDRDANNTFTDRYTVNASNSYNPIKDMTLTIPIFFTANQSHSNDGTPDPNSIYPYAQLADAHGNPLDIVYQQGKTDAFNEQAVSQGLYSYHYSPLEEYRLNPGTQYSTQEIRINPTLNYSFLNGFSAQIQYSYDHTSQKQTNDQSDSLFSVRNIINQYTQVNPDGSLSFPINRGDMLSIGNQSQTDQDIRAQLNYNNYISKNSRIDALAGYEYSQSQLNSNTNAWYGYNPNTGQVQTNVNYTTAFPQYGLPYSSNIPVPSSTPLKGQFFALDSKFANATYTYKDRYLLSGSGRIDETNIFGATANGKHKILWSAGGSWIINKEKFYSVPWLPELKLSATYGYQGNIAANNSVGIGLVTAVVPIATISYSYFPNQAGLNYAMLNNVPNPDLTWEKIGQLNLRMDFTTKNNILNGKIEYYHKNGSGLIAEYPTDPTIGVSTNTGNVANISGQGIDVTLNTKNIDSHSFTWNTIFILNYNKDKVTKYLVPYSLYNIISQATASYPYEVSPIVGHAIYGVYSLKSAGLDPQTGDPRGYDANGNISEDYNALTDNTPIKNLVYSGSANPTLFGSIMNNFSYKGFGISVLLTYQTGFYFHVQSVNYGSLYGGTDLTAGADYDKRWQKPGDEKTTYVPSAPTVVNNNYLRDEFYQESSVLVQKGDNIRIQDVALTYDVKPSIVRKLHLSYAEFYGNATLNTILWRANHMNIDPEYPQQLPAKVFSLGLRMSF